MPANVRQISLRALLEWEKGRTFADEIIQRQLEQAQLSTIDRAFVRETFFGILRHLSELDYLVDQLRQGTLDAQTRAVLRLGLYQLFHMRIPAHAAVNETVALGGHARGLVNAVLRRALREKTALEGKLQTAPRSARTSHPDFLLERWTKQFGAEATEQLCLWNNQPSDVYVRANGLRVTIGELLQSAGDAVAAPFHPKALRARRLPLSWIVMGLCYVQDPSTLVSCDLLDPQPGETILDACAAPGGKTTYIAELMENSGRIVACDIFESRILRMRENLARLGVEIAEVHQLDVLTAAGADPLLPASFDRILIDAPCSNTGVIRRRVDVRWRLTDEDFIRMPVTQIALVRKLAPLLKRGGTLVYSTCSLEPEENDAVVEQIQREQPLLRFVESRRTLPFIDAVDGAFAAKFVRLG